MSEQIIFFRQSWESEGSLEIIIFGTLGPLVYVFAAGTSPRGRLQKHLRDLIEALFQGRHLNQPQKLLGGVLGLLGADWLNQEQDVMRNPEEEQ